MSDRLDTFCHMSACKAPVKGHKDPVTRDKCPSCSPKIATGSSLRRPPTVARVALEHHPETERWLCDPRLAKFLGTVGVDHHPWLQDFAEASNGGHDPRLPGSNTSPCVPVRVGMDIDEVIYPWEENFRDYAAKHEGFDWEQCTPRTAYHEFPVGWGFRDDEHFVSVMRRGETAANLNTIGDPYPDSAQALKEIVASGHSLHLITARFPHGGQTERETVEWLEKHDLPYSSLTISRDKRVVYSDLFLDDKAANCDQIADAGTLSVMKDASHNQSRDNHLRIGSLAVWADIVTSYSRWSATQER